MEDELLFPCTVSVLVSVKTLQGTMPAPLSRPSVAGPGKPFFRKSFFEGTNAKSFNEINCNSHLFGEERVPREGRAQSLY